MVAECMGSASQRCVECDGRILDGEDLCQSCLDAHKAGRPEPPHCVSCYCLLEPDEHGLDFCDDCERRRDSDFEP